jgi:hypothetical protein
MADLKSDKEDVCIDNNTLEALVDNIVSRLKSEVFDNQYPFITEKEAMELLNIHSKTTMKKYRDEGKIDYRKPEGTKQIYYKRKSLIDFIENSPK